jgi:parallel beta-helix repeat protein
MKKNISGIILTFIIANFFIQIIPLAYSAEYLEYDPVSNTCIVTPTGADDTLNLIEAFNTVISGGSNGTVQLVEGVYTISDEIVVVNFDGWFQGAGMGKTVIENIDTDFWPHRKVENFPELAGLFVFYQTDETPRSLRFSDMTIRVQGKTEPYYGFTGMNVIEIYGRVNLDNEDIYDTEINTICENMRFEGKRIEAFHGYNTINTFTVGGEMFVTDNWYFKPITGVHVVNNCTFINVGGGPKYNSLKGTLVMKNNRLENVTYGLIEYDPLNLGYEGNSIYKNNHISGVLLDGFWLSSAKNTILEKNTISGCLFGNGINMVNCINTHIQDNIISYCNQSGIHIQGSTNNTYENNALYGNGLDFNWDGKGSNSFYDEISNSNWIVIINQLVEEIKDIQDELNDANTIIAVQETELVEANLMITSLNNQISSLEDQIISQEDQISSLEDQIISQDDQISAINTEISDMKQQIKSMLTYTTAAVIILAVGILTGAIGYITGKRT